MKKQKSKAPVALFLTVAVVTMTLTGCKEKDGPAGKKAGAEAKAETVYAVNTYLAHAGTLDAYLEFGGDVQAMSSVDILPDTNGKIFAVHVTPGTFVRRNQLIAEIDPSRPGMFYEKSPVRASIDGTITSLPYSIGTTVAPSMSMGKIATANDLQVTVSVAERYVARIQNNLSAQLTFDAYPGEVFPAHVVEVSPVLNEVSRTMQVKLRLDTDDQRIKIGMYARVKLITDEHKGVLVLPYSALVRRGEDNYVFVVDTQSNTVSQVKVIAGLRVDDQIEISQGIHDGDEVVIKGQTLLNDGAKINVLSTVKQGSEA
jgi:multidrug efflux pump subunit AcrA (membrane-fusion protein)